MTTKAEANLAAIKARLSGNAPPTNRQILTDSTHGTPRGKGVGNRAAAADAKAAAATAAATAAAEAAAEATGEDPFAELDLSDPDAIATAQANDIELYPNAPIDSIGPAELKKMADRLEEEIDSLEMQIKDGTSVKLRASPEERARGQAGSEELKRQIQEKRSQYKDVVDRLIDAHPDRGSRPEQQYEPYTRRREPVYPKRGWEKAAEKAREAETGEKTLARFYPSSYEGFGVGQSEVELPIEGGGVAKFAHSRARDREAREDIGIPTPLGTLGVPGVSLRMEPGPIDMAGRIAGAAIDKYVLGGDWSQVEGEMVPEHDPRQGGEMFAPRAGGNKLNMPKLEAEMAEREINILGAKQRIKELETSLEDTTWSVPEGETYGEIELLKDDIEQMDAELAQMMRIKQVTAPEIEKAQEAEMLQDEFGTQF